MSSGQFICAERMKKAFEYSKTQNNSFWMVAKNASSKSSAIVLNDKRATDNREEPWQRDLFDDSAARRAENRVRSPFAHVDA